jgi:hypothetical protein
VEVACDLAQLQDLLGQLKAASKTLETLVG